MALDPIIAGGYRGVEIPNALQQYAQVTGIQNAMQEQRMREMQMRQLEQESATRNALAQRLQSGQPFTVAEAARFGKPGYDVLTAQRQSAEAEDKQKKAAADLAASYVKQARDQLPMVNDPQTYTAWRAQTLQRLPGFESFIPPEYSPEIVGRLALDADKMLEQHFVSQNLGGEQQVLAMPKYGAGPARVVPGSRAAEVPLPAGVEAQKGRIAQRGAAQTRIVLPEQEKAFESELGKGQAKALLDSRAGAEDARSIIDTVNQGRDILKSGMITGAGADFLVSLNQGLKTLGIDFGYADAAANSQAFMANMGQNVGKLIKQFGAGTGLSDADRKYAEQIAGGKINLDPKALTKILDINERAARNVIKAHNRKAEGVKTNVPLKVEEPTTARQLSPLDQQALDWANANPKDPRAAQIKQRLGM